jgi:antitoxin component of RelBE/YafQ-DinJ toxin-antitoxin module
MHIILCNMKNLTMRVDEEVLARAREVAAEQSTSVNALVRGFLEDLALRENRKEAARREILDLCDHSRARAGKRTWTRDELYERL